MNNLYECLKCKEQFVTKESNGIDGMNCRSCRGPIVLIGGTTRPENVEVVRDVYNTPWVSKKKKTGALTVDVEVNGIDEAIKKAETLKKIYTQIDTLQQRIIAGQEKLNVARAYNVNSELLDKQCSAEEFVRQMDEAIRGYCRRNTEI